MNLNKILFTYIILLCFKVSGEELFLDQHINDLDPFSVHPEDLEIEYDYLKVQQQRNGTSIKYNDKQNQVGWSFKFMDFIDLDTETENRFVRLQFLKLNQTDCFDAIGIEALEEAKMHRIFIRSDGYVGYSYQNELVENENNQKIYQANRLQKDIMFLFDQGDIVQVFYYAEEKSLLIYNQTKDNLFKLPESLLSLAGRRFKVFVCISREDDHVFLSNTF